MDFSPGREAAIAGQGAKKLFLQAGQRDDQQPRRHRRQTGQAQLALRAGQQAGHGPAHAAGKQRPAQAFQHKGQAQGAQK